MLLQFDVWVFIMSTRKVIDFREEVVLKSDVFMVLS